MKAADSPVWLVVRLHGRVDPRPLNPDSPEDFAVIAARYVADSREQVVEKMFDEIRRDAVIDDALVARCVETLRNDGEIPDGE